MYNYKRPGSSCSRSVEVQGWGSRQLPVSPTLALLLLFLSRSPSNRLNRLPRTEVRLVDLQLSLPRHHARTCRMGSGILAVVQQLGSDADVMRRKERRGGGQGECGSRWKEDVGP
eukprot:755883-Hanusia_phi.AAC.2